MAANPISFYLFLFCNIFEQGQGNAHSDVYFFSRDSDSDKKSRIGQGQKRLTEKGNYLPDL